MGEFVKRPIKEGEGVRPTTPKPRPPVRAVAGERPHTPKPTRDHTDSKGSTEQS